MGLFGTNREECSACGYQFDSRDKYVNHITNIHPKTKPCTKCTGTTYWTHQDHVDEAHRELHYICVECGFILESWRVVDSWDFIKEKNRSKGLKWKGSN
jgi:Zn ribbon nucleic-acid-binding protein